MARHFQPTGSKSFFVGRKRELEQINRVLLGGQPHWIIQIQGDGGIGKTRLLEFLRDRAREKAGTEALLCTDLIDFQQASNRTEFGLLAEIARQLGEVHFPHFKEEREILKEILTASPDASLYREAVRRVAIAFFDDCKLLLKNGRRMFLLFDTCEEMHDMTSWVMGTFLPQLLQMQEDIQTESNADAAELPVPQPQIFTVWAGRTPLPLPKRFSPYLLNHKLSPFNLKEVQEFFQQAAKWFPGTLTKRQLVKLNARCGGRPLYIALCYDWLKNGMGLIEDLIGNHGPFGEKLVKWISRLTDLQDDVILLAALAWRRMEPGLLAALLNISLKEAKKQLEMLSGFSFVKYSPVAPGFQLHDEMRDLVRRHLWPRESPWEIKAMLQRIIGWYKKRLGNTDLLEGRELPKTDEMRALLAEYVYYECELDPNVGSRIGERLFKRNVHYLDLAFCELLNHEISRFEKRLSNDRIDQLRFQQALVAFRKEEFDFASELWHSLIRRPDCDKKLQGTSHTMLIELEGYIGQYSEALQHAESAEKIYQLISGQPGLDMELRELVARELGQAYNNRGYIYRVQGQLQHACQYYQKALDHYQKAFEHHKKPLEQAGIQKNIARCFNNIGYVYFLQGDTEKAVTHIGRALQIRQKLGIAFECGLGSNTLGMVMEDMGRIDHAADLYQKAYYYFEAARSDRGAALVLINLGRLWRITNSFDKALEALRRAGKILEDKGDTAWHLVALNEIGCAFRQQATAETRRLAERYLHESLRLSKKIKNYQAIADNLDDLQILFYQWGADFKKQGRQQMAERYLKQAKEYGREARKVAKAHGLTTILANIERANGDICFELQDYDKAFKHLLNACQLIAQAAHKKERSAVQLQQRLTENANRVQQRLHALPKQEQTQKYAKKILTWMDRLPKDDRPQLFLLRTFVNETLQLSQYPLVAM
ncbi:MAG: tetratricopeptide repeat protein [bacterium]